MLIRADQVTKPTKPFQGTWASATTVTFGPRAGQPDTVRLRLSDGGFRSVDANPALTWNGANGVADLGYDEAGSQGVSKWLYWYAVPATGDDTTLTLVASDNAPGTGPTGRTAFKHVWTDYLDSSGNLLAVDQLSGNTFKYRRARIALSLNSGAADAVTQLVLTNFVPATGGRAEVLLYYQANGTRGALIVWVTGNQALDVGDPSNENNQTWQLRNGANCPDNTFGTGSQHGYLSTPVALKDCYYQPKSSCNVALVHVCGWIDDSIEGNASLRKAS